MGTLFLIIALGLIDLRNTFGLYYHQRREAFYIRRPYKQRVHNDLSLHNQHQAQLHALKML